MIKPSISVIVPVYNGERFIQGFIASFSKQVFKDYELIFVDDGSNDKSKDLIFKTMELYPELNYKYFYQDNGGVSSARNKGIELSNGDYICFVDIDDFVCDCFLQELYLSCKNNNKMIAISLFARKEVELSNTGNVEVLDSNSFFKNAIFSDLRFGIVSSIIRKDVFLSNRITFPVGYKFGEDIYTLFRCVLSESEIVFLTKKMYLYVVNQSSAMHTSVSPERKQNIELMNSLVDEISYKHPNLCDDFKKYYISRLYWSIFWQAARFYDSFKQFNKFLSEFDDYKIHLINLKKYPNKRVRISTKLLLFSKRSFFFATKLYFKFSKERV